MARRKTALKRRGKHQRSKSPKARRLGGFFSSPDLPADLDETSKAEASGRRNKLTAQVASLRK